MLDFDLATLYLVEMRIQTKIKLQSNQLKNSIFNWDKLT